MTYEEKVIWSAGFFDGEGCACIAKQARKDTTWMSYVLSVSVCQKDPRPLDILHELYGGRVLNYKLKGITYHRWVANSNQAVAILNAMLPYLILKKDRAEVCIEFQTNLVSFNQDYGRRGYPEWVRSALAGFYEKMKFLNKRGVSDDNPNPLAPGAKRGGKNFFAGKNRISIEIKSKETETLHHLM
jgi:hypothetical protein